MTTWGIKYLLAQNAFTINMTIAEGKFPNNQLSFCWIINLPNYSGIFWSVDFSAYKRVNSPRSNIRCLYNNFFPLIFFSEIRFRVFEGIINWFRLSQSSATCSKNSFYHFRLLETCVENLCLQEKWDKCTDKMLKRSL